MLDVAIDESAWATEDQAGIISIPYCSKSQGRRVGEVGMLTVELLEEAIGTAEQLGYKIREECLGGVGGGSCEFGGRKWLFLDLALGASDQLDQVLSVLKEDPATGVVAAKLSPQLAWHLGLRRAAA